MNVFEYLVTPSAEPALVHVTTRARTTRTYDELTGNVRALTAALHGLGVREGDSILILAGTTIESLESILAAFNLGASAMPVSPLLGSRGILEIIRERRPKCCVFSDPLKQEIDAALGECASALVSLRPGGPPGAHVYESILRDYAVRCAEVERRDFGPRQSALIMHSSGSQGRPKAIHMSHGELQTFSEHNGLLYAQFTRPEDPETSTSPFVSVLPLSHLGGLGLCLQGLLVGRTTYLLSVFVAETYLRLIEETKCNLLSLVPSMYRGLLEELKRRSADVASVRFCITLGEPCSIELASRIEDVFGATVVSAHGLTECLTGLCHTRERLFGGGVKRGSCGRHHFGELKLVDEHGRENPEFGELWVRNPTVHACYLDADLNEERIFDGWFRTKDLFFRDADGDFFYRGRCDDMFICSGKNVYPAEIEATLHEHPDVDLACAAPVYGSDDAPITAVLIQAKRPLTESEIQQFCARHGPSHAIPKLVRFVEVFPRIGPGKIDRVASARLLQDAYELAAQR